MKKFKSIAVLLFITLLLPVSAYSIKLRFSNQVGQKYRIKVLTPDGHVKVMAISSEASKNPSSNQSTKNPPEKNPGGKERH